MSRAETAPVPTRSSRFPGTSLRRARRDSRRFGRAKVWTLDNPATESELASDLRLFAQSFAAFFLFFSLLIV